MAKYEALPTISVVANDTMLRTHQLPELVHMDDPALSVMTDFMQVAPYIIDPSDTMDHAIHEMEVSGVHLLLVMNNEGHFQGILTSEDVWGEKPIKIIQERRVHRDQVLVRQIMVPYTEVTAIDFNLLSSARVGNIVKTLSERKQHYALAVLRSEENATQIIRGIFTASQISNQLHIDIEHFFG